jgi:phenylacetate-CoA ligase
VTFLDTACACGSAHRLIADVQGRLDEVFTYAGGQVVHLNVFGGLLRRDPGIVEYQVPAGAEVLVVGDPADPAALARGLEAELARLGVPDPAVEVRLVDQLDRQAAGKVRLFLPLALAEASLPA